MSTSIIKARPGAVPLPAYRILDTWSNHPWDNGLQIESLCDFAEIDVVTRNSVYQITVIDPFSRSILVRGGRFFTEKTPARLAGSSFGWGGGFLKLGGIYIGLSIEIVTDQDTFISTHVKSIRLYEPTKRDPGT